VCGTIQVFNRGRNVPRSGTYMRDFILIVAILLASRAALWGVCRFERVASPELARKLLHVAMGVILCPLPWVFDSAGPVLALCGVYVGLLAGRRYLVALDNHVSGVLDGVGRKSLGEFLFPITVAGLFVAARGDRAAYLIPLLVLTFADAAAAVVGRRYGTVRYPTPGGCKSLEGSLAFAVVTFAAVHLPLLLMGRAGAWESVLVAVVMALVLTVVEAVATGGWDNLLVPAGALVMLKGLAGTAVPPLAVMAAVAGVGVLGLILVYGRWDDAEDWVLAGGSFPGVYSRRAKLWRRPGREMT
jgi:phytol kinase